MTAAKKYKHETSVLDNGHLQARCFEGREPTPHWSGTAHDQALLGVARAFLHATQELYDHIKDTGHTAFKHRHGGPR